MIKFCSSSLLDAAQLGVLFAFEEFMLTFRKN